LGYNTVKAMQKINIQYIKRLYNRFKQKYVNINNAVILVGFVIAANWVWGALGVMQRNYNLQKELDDKTKQLVVAQLDTENARLEQRYYKTREYQELAVREHLGLVLPGDKVLILPPNSNAAKNEELTLKSKPSLSQPKQSNFSQWMNFLFGGNSKSLSK
jgi:hypothetical protein